MGYVPTPLTGYRIHTTFDWMKAAAISLLRGSIVRRQIQCPRYRSAYFSLVFFLLVRRCRRRVNFVFSIIVLDAVG
jgi:hypothetical protein